MRIYTKLGDAGKTGLLYGGRISKNDPRCEAYGTIDECVSALGLARAHSKDPFVKDILYRFQRELFTVAAELSTAEREYEKLKANFSVTTLEMTAHIELLIDELNNRITIPRAFIIPGASVGSATIDLARTILRRAERGIVNLQEQQLLVNQEILRYINRLSDLLFMLARFEDREIPMELLNPDRTQPQEEPSSQ
jgi:cob(I)alamin adenosyltransferase